MFRRILAVSLALALVALPAVLADPDEGPVDDLLGKDRKDPQPTSTEPIVEAQKEVVGEEPTAPAAGFLDGLLGGAAGLVKDVGGAIASGVTGAVSAVGDAFLLVVTFAWDTTVWAVTGVADGTATAVLWSVTGVWAVMYGITSGTLHGLGIAVAALWDGLGLLALGLAGLRPEGMSQGAWAGTVAIAVTGASAAANLGLVEALRRVAPFGLGGLPLFSRIAKDDILDHPLRAEIFETIKTNPGIHISALARSVDAGWGTTIHHLRKLQEKELVAVRMVNNQKCFFHNGGTVGRNAWTQLPELKNETAARIAHFVLANPLTPVTAISAQLGISPSLVSHHVRKLEKAGVVEKHRDGRFVKLAVTDGARSGIFGEAPAGVAAETTGIAA